MKYLICLFAFASGAAMAHPGATDAKGCHKKGAESHCHKSASASASDSFKLSDPEVKEEVNDPKCVTGDKGVRYKMVNGKKVAC
jgi:hypothetical protein